MPPAWRPRRMGSTGSGQSWGWSISTGRHGTTSCRRRAAFPSSSPPESGPGFYFFEDSREQDPGKRFKGLIRTYAAWAADPDGPEAGSGGTDAATAGQKFHLYFSPDGFEWTAYEDNPVIDYSPKPGRWGPTDFMGWDPVRQVYAVHMENNLHWRGPLGKRVIGRAESPDMIHWSEAETILVPGKRDTPDTEYYALPVTVYEGLYVGVLWNFRTTNLTHHPQIVFSRNGIHYNREYREPFIARGPRDHFDANSVYARAPIVHGDRILVYYYGTNSRSPEQAFDLGENATTAIGLATLPLDGFVSLDGAKGPPDYRPAPTDIEPHSLMATRSFGFSGERLYLNLQAPPALQQRRAMRGSGGGPDRQPRTHSRIHRRGRRCADDHRQRPRRQLERKSAGRPASGAGDPPAVPLQERQALLVPVPVVDCPGIFATSMPPTTTHERIGRRLIA